jgi:Protein of unknown function (DUF4232)
MTTSPARVAVVLLPLMLVCACSFRGSVTDAQSSSSAHSPGTSTSTGAASSGESTGATSTGPVGTSTGESTPPAGGGPSTDRCHTSELTGRLIPADSGAGQRYATLTLRNAGGRSCTIHGYGGLGLVDGSGHALPTKQIRDASPAATTVRLAPGGTVSSDLHWGAVPGPGDNQSGDCQPAPAALHVIPPDETDFLSVPWDMGPVCLRGTIEQRAYVG